MKHVNSQITGQRKELQNLSGIEFGVLGAAIGQPTAEDSRADSKKLVAMPSKAVMQNLQSLMLSHNVNAVVNKNWKTGRVLSMEISPATEKASEENLKLLKALSSKIEYFFVPALVEDIESMIAELDAISKKRGRSDGEATIALGAYVSRLSQYPADVVRYVLIDHTFEWFPSWPEMKEVCENIVSYRNALRLKVSQAITHTSEKLNAPQVEKKPNYDFDADAIRAEIRARKQQEAAQ